jgi:hypothetical protein
MKNLYFSFSHQEVQACYLKIEKEKQDENLNCITA